MTQRKCGTCRYFEEGGIAASGWCRHPERQELQHMVLVRKTELACRDGWDHDLWEPKDGSSGDNGTGPRSSGGSIPAGGGLPVEGARSRGGDDGPGTATALLEGSAGTAVRPRESTDRGRREHPASVFETEWSPFDTPSLPFDRARDSEPVDEIQGETFSTRGLRLTSGPRQSPHAETREEPENRAGPAPGERNGTRSAHRDDLHPFNRPAPDGGNRFGARREDVPANGQAASGDVEPGSFEPEPVEQSGMTEPFEFTDPEPNRPEPAPEPEPGPMHGQGTMEPQSDGEEPMSAGEPYPEYDDLDDNHVSLNVPIALQQEQCCRTCRDFRPAEGGQQGWCNNPFAFEGRQRVDADDLACRGTFGSWWSPADDWWIERADISHHSTPTPLVDELIRASQEDGDQRPRSTEKRRSS